MPNIAYQAYSKDCRTTADTARKAAITFFEKFPNKRKCDVIKGESDGVFFVVKYGRLSLGEWPNSYKGVTKNTAQNLPD